MTHPPQNKSTCPLIDPHADGDVLQKIQRVYGLSDEEMQLPPTSHSKLGYSLHHQLSDGNWLMQCTIAKGASPDCTATHQELSNIATEIVHRYAQALHVQESMLEKRRTANHAYDSLPHPNRLTQQLIEHIGDHAEGELLKAGLGEKQAHALHQKIIGITTNIVPQHKASPMENPTTPTLQNNANRIAFHERAFNDVRRKIQKVYGLSDEAVALPNNLYVITQRWSNRHFWDESWNNARTIATNASPECTASAQNIQETAREVILKYVETLYLRNQMSSASGHGFYHLDKSREQMGKILTNHVSNWAEAKLRHLGLTPASAHALHGHLIGHSINIANALMPRAAHSVKPQQGSLGRATPTEIEARIDELKHYGTHTARELEGRYRTIVPYMQNNDATRR